MAWTTPNTSWTTGGLVGATDMNNIGNDLLALYTAATVMKQYKPGAAINTNSTSFVALDSTNLAMSLTIKRTKIAVLFFGHLGQNGGGTAYFDIAIDGARIGNATTGLLDTTVAYNTAMRGVFGVSGVLTPGTKNIQLYAKHSVGGAQYASSFTEAILMMAWEL